MYSLGGEAESTAALRIALRGPCERPCGERVEQRVGDGDEERGLQYLPPAGAEHLERRCLDDALVLLRGAECRGLLHVHTHEQSYNHQQ